MKKYPYREQPDSVPVFRRASRSLGWNRTIENALLRAEKEVVGLKKRIKSVYFLTANPEQSTKPIPAAYFNDKIFEPSDQILELDFQGNWGSGLTGPVPFNVILDDNQIYNVPLQITGPGVFVAKYLTVTMTFRLFVPDVGIFQIPLAPATWGPDKEFKFGIASSDANVGIDGTAWNKVAFFWNLIDTGSGRRLADDLMPDIYLLPQVADSSGNAVSYTGNLWQFDVPWVFERDSQLTFEFKPSAFLQVDPSSGVLPFGYDDREQNGTFRNNQVDLKVELHGTRYLQERDRGYKGAIVTKLSP